jgi:putative membrane protein
MKHFILKWLISAIALVIIVHIFPGVHSADLLVTIITALVLSLLNTFLKPILGFLTFPVLIVTLGLFMLVINAFLFWLAGELIKGFHVEGFWTAFWAALVYSIITLLINSLVKSEKY